MLKMFLFKVNARLDLYKSLVYTLGLICLKCLGQKDIKKLNEEDDMSIDLID